MQVSHESHLTQPSLSTLIIFIKLFFFQKKEKLLIISTQQKLRRKQLMEANYIFLEYFLYFLFCSRAKGCHLRHVVLGMCQVFLECLRATSIYSFSLSPILIHRHLELAGIS